MVVLSTHTERSRIALEARRRPPGAAAPRQDGARPNTTTTEASEDDPPTRQPRRLEKQGLYDPAYEHDACGVGFVANIRGEKSHDVVHEGHPRAREPRAPRRLRLRSGDRRRRRPARPGARRASCAARCARSGIELPEPGRYAVGMIFLAQDPAAAARQAAILEQPRRERGPARARLARRARRRRRRSAGSRARACRASASSSSRRRRRGRRSGRLRAQALRDPPARGEADRAGARGRHFFYVHELLEPHARLHGHADLAPDPGLLPGRLRSRVRVGALPRALALQHQHARRPGISRIRSATSRTTARSTRSSGNQNWMHAREGTMSLARCSATTSRSSTRSCATGRPTPRASTTCSSSWCWRAASCPKRS